LVEAIYETLTQREEVERRLEGEALRLPQASEEEGLEVDDLFSLLEALELLGFARVEHGDVELKAAGLALGQADLQRQKALFAEHLLRHVPLMARLHRVLLERGRLPEKRGRFFHLPEPEETP
jgi:NitT/TauT family transport system ATP-binding protein